jgi:hypothetical protein
MQRTQWRGANAGRVQIYKGRETGEMSLRVVLVKQATGQVPRALTGSDKRKPEWSEMATRHLHPFQTRFRNQRWLMVLHYLLLISFHLIIFSVFILLLLLIF